MDILFNSVNNLVFIKLCQIINQINRGSQYNYGHIMDLIKNEYNPDYAKDFEEEEQLVKTIFDFDSKGMAHIRSHLDFHMPILQNEEDFLADYCQHRDFFWLTPSNLREKISTFLGKTALSTNSGAESPLEEKQLITLLKSLNENVEIIIQKENQAPNNYILHRLEYNILTKEYALLVSQNKKIEKLPLTSIKDIGLSKNKAPDNKEDIFLDALKSLEQTISFTFSSNRNTADRCFAFFESYEKITERLDENTFRMKVTYFNFDEEDIFNFLLSLGANVVVTAPKEARTKMIHLLEEAYAINQ